MRYDYGCPHCDYIQRDVEQTLAQVEAGEAPFCHECAHDCGCENPHNHAMTRLIGPTSFALKGGGWASDGYSSGKADK